MGLYDRDYTRSERYGSSSPLALGQSMVLTIIVINVAVFLADLLFGGPQHRITYALAASGDSLAKPWLWWQLLTSGFAHDPTDLWHLVFNMLGLWFLGRFVEESLGRWEFLRFYLVAIVLGSIVHAARVCLFVDHEWWSHAIGLGASGGVVAVIILFVCKFPHVRMLFGIPAWVMGLIVVALDMLGHGGVLLNPFGSDQRAATVAYDVHLTGAAFALAYFFGGMNFGRWLPSQWGSVAAKASQALRPRPKLQVHSPAEDDLDDDEYRDLDEQADRILAKVGAQGESSLSAKERRILEDYSRRMRQKHR